jgi:hypothetical protein
LILSPCSTGVGSSPWCTPFTRMSASGEPRRIAADPSGRPCTTAWRACTPSPVKGRAQSASDPTTISPAAMGYRRPPTSSCIMEPGPGAS